MRTSRRLQSPWYLRQHCWRDVGGKRDWLRLGCVFGGDGATAGRQAASRRPDERSEAAQMAHCREGRHGGSECLKRERERQKEVGGQGQNGRISAKPRISSLGRRRVRLLHFTSSSLSLDTSFIRHIPNCLALHDHGSTAPCQGLLPLQPVRVVRARHSNAQLRSKW